MAEAYTQFTHPEESPASEPQKIVFVMRDATDKGPDTLWVATTVVDGDSPQVVKDRFWNAYLTWRNLRG